jgi:hypothetical protein
VNRRTFLTRSALVSGAVALFGCGSGHDQAVSGDTIAAENAKPGDPSWVLTNPATQHEIEGFASATSINRGETITFFVSAKDPSYTVEIYRMGWYGGVGGRKLMSAITQPGIPQTIPPPDPLTGLIECKWRATYALSVPDNTGDPTDWASGVYLAKLTGLPSRKQSYIIFVVRDDGRQSQYLFQSSVTTYQAYNNWGGKSLYDYNSTGGRAAKVSFNRPYAPSLNLVSGSGIGGGASGVGAGEFLTTYVPAAVSPYPTGWEYNMLRFLERNGYEVAYATDIDIHENASLLLKHSAFLSVGHDEYWSWDQRTNVIKARDSGVNLGFFAADVCYWQIRFEPSPVTGAPNRTQVCYKDASDPVTGSRQTILWRDLGMPEAEFVGVMYLNDRANADIQIQNKGNWAFAGTGLQDGARLAGLLGYEVDTASGSSPPNLVVLANSPFQLNSDPSQPVQYSQMATYTAASGATVFATGSMQWNWGLDDYNAPALRPSRLSIPAEQITKNVLTKLAQR